MRKNGVLERFIFINTPCMTYYIATLPVQYLSYQRQMPTREFPCRHVNKIIVILNICKKKKK